MKKQNGFSLVEVTLVVIVIALVGFMGYMAYTNFLAPKSTDSAAESNETVKIENKEDLDKAEAALEDVPVDDGDQNELDNTTKDF